ncbi:MAG: hypothetical protein GF346_03155 [Candidatus Eisenbacteria bacterium]|nr:hypothetical protein [Candidatus Latescibacterota bacterium]MBD3301419.1 hypothetical protein [Candidatus Eisenbacteria bacterium]
MMKLANRPVELGMTSSEEQATFIRYAREEHRGIGEMVDLGCWLGSTTISLAKGWRDNPARRDGEDRRIHAYDRFVWHPTMEPIVAGTELRGRWREGDLFLDEFERRVAPWRELIEVYPGDLREQDWIGRPIEFLLVDAMKSWELAGRIVRVFYPHLVPGASLVVHQDFGHDFTSWIHLLHYRFRDHFALHRDLPHSASTIFRFLEPIPPERLELPVSANSFTDEEIEAAFELSFSLVAERKRPEVAGAKVMAFYHRNDLDRAGREVERLRREGIAMTGGLLRAARLVREAGKGDSHE